MSNCIQLNRNLHFIQLWPIRNPHHMHRTSGTIRCCLGKTTTGCIASVSLFFILYSSSV